jgi:hypothetical protein
MNTHFKVKPPDSYLSTPRHHFLHLYDDDNKFIKEIVLQWDPINEQWVASGQLGSGVFVDTTNMQYVAVCVPCRSIEQSK